MSASSGEITLLLQRWASGDTKAVSELAPYVYDHLRSVAQSYLRRESPGHTLQATALVNELFLVLIRQQKTTLDNRSHFYSFAARTMRRILVDHARSRMAAKRGGGQRTALSQDLAWVDPQSAEMVDLDAALEELSQSEPEKARVVDLRIFLGATATETSSVLGRSKASVDRDLRFALAWLYRKVHPALASPGETA